MKDSDDPGLEAGGFGVAKKAKKAKVSAREESLTRWVAEKTGPLLELWILTNDSGPWLDGWPLVEKEETEFYDMYLRPMKAAWLRSKAADVWRKKVVLLLMGAEAELPPAGELVGRDFMWLLHSFSFCERLPSDLENWVESMSNVYPPLVKEEDD